jgi:prepilin peptidase CpaA
VFGRIETIQLLVFIVAGIAAVSDFWSGRIFNTLTVPALIAGLISASYWLGWSGLGQALLGVLAGLALFGWIFWLRHLGGGDVKLLMAFGAIGGPRFAFEVAILSVLVGGVLSLGSLAYRGRLHSFLLKIKIFIYSLMVTGMAVEVPESDRSLTIPFGIPMAIAAVLTVFLNPFHILIHSSFQSWEFSSSGGYLWP